MITDSKEYFRLLYEIQDNNPPSIAVLVPSYEPFVEVNMDERKIYAPEFISINKDHRSETVFFKMPRYLDHMDLSQTCGIVQYINAAGEGRVYPIPFYDLDTCSDENMMLFPWVIEGEATKKAGTVKFSLRFFIMDSTGTSLLYNVSTMTAEAKVLEGMNFTYDEIYEEVNLSLSSYRKGVYYIKLKNGHYELSDADFDPQQVYYEKTTLDMNESTNWSASFLEQMIAEAHEAASHDLTWIVI